MPWGGRRLGRFLGKNLPGAETYGESWEVSDHALHASRLATASDFGVTLRELMTDHCRELLGSAADRFAVFPWLIKWLDANDWLSVQVHPDDDAVQRLRPGESGKTEAWYILDAEPTSRIYAGLKPGVDAPQLRRCLPPHNDKPITDCLHSFAPTPGDFVFIPAGTVHAMGGGILIAEIQQTSDATFRLFDWNRPRPLHVEESLASIHWGQGPVEPISANDARSTLVRCPFFQVERWSSNGSSSLGGRGEMQALIVTHGHGRFDNGEFAAAGDVWVLPARMPAMALHAAAPMRGLLCSLPE